MNENNPNRGEKAASQKTLTGEAVIHGHHEQSEQAEPAEQNARDELCDWEDPGIRRIRKWCVQFSHGWKRMEFHDKCTVAMTGIGLLVLIAYTVFTGMMWCANKEAADAARTSANAEITSIHLDQRAWILATHAPIAFPIDSPIVVSGQIRNTGKTPARRVNASFTTVVLSKDELPEFVYEAGTGHPTTKVEADVFFPDARPERYESRAFKQHIKQLEDTVMTKQLMTEIVKGNQFIVVHGEISYDDIFGTHHWQTYCRLYPEFLGVRKPAEKVPPLVDACRKHNDMDKNDFQENH
jgi:hypothetical protein